LPKTVKISLNLIQLFRKNCRLFPETVYNVRCVLDVSVYHAVYLDNLMECHLREKLACLYDVLPTHILELYLQGPSGIHILVSDHVSLHLTFDCIKQNIVLLHCDRLCFAFFLSISSVTQKVEDEFHVISQTQDPSLQIGRETRSNLLDFLMIWIWIQYFRLV